MTQVIRIEWTACFATCWMNECTLNTNSLLPTGIHAETVALISHSVNIFDLLEGTNEQTKQEGEKRAKEEDAQPARAPRRAAAASAPPRPAGVRALPPGARPLLWSPAPGRAAERLWRGSSQPGCNSASETSLRGRRRRRGARRGGSSGRCGAGSPAAGTAARARAWRPGGRAPSRYAPRPARLRCGGDLRQTQLWRGAVPG